MPKQSKSKSSEVSEQVSVDAGVAPVVSEKPTRSRKSKASTQQTQQVEVVSTSDVVVSTQQEQSVVSSEPVVASSSDENVVVPTSDETETAIQTAEFVSKLSKLSELVAFLKSEFKSLEKKYLREIKLAQKKSTKNKRKSGNRQPSGFVKPTKISDELAKFLDKPVGTEMARTDVTREINKYIRLHNLQDKDNGRKINPDSKLQSLLKLKKTDELTYFNLQRYMSPHFSKASKETTTA